MQFHHSDIKFIKSILKSWETINPENIHFERLAGLSNVIYRVTALDQLASPASVIYRKFGENSEIINREQENYVFTELAKRGLGPSYHGGDDKSRVEGFYESRPLKATEVNEIPIRRGVAKSLAALHQVQIEDLDKKPVILRVLEDGGLIKTTEAKAQKDIYTPEESAWLKDILTLAGEEEINFLKEILPTKTESIVFSHNDLHAQNILLLDQSQRLVLIDYEYASYNYRGYDIANFFNEACIDYTNEEYPYYTLDTNKYPCDADLIDFIKYYLFFSKFNGRIADEQAALDDEAYLKRTVQELGDLEAFNQEIEEIYKEVRVCAMLSHYYWVLWSVVMSKNPEVNFDYIEYAKRRYDVYQQLKQKYTSAEYPDIQKLILSE